VDNENGRPPDPDEPPCELKTVNQIVAWNVAWYRRAAGFTQEQLGERIGRTKRNVSADERSWDGGHTREFSAHDLAVLAAAFGIPVTAFFLPPDDDGIRVRYELDAGEYIGRLDMGQLMEMAMPDSADVTRVLEAYRHRLITAVRQYLGVSWADDLERWQYAMTGLSVREEQIEDAEADRDSLARLVAKLTRGIEARKKEAAG
jgi:transcriptional regulator with XRE-family HTH domain